MRSADGGPFLDAQKHALEMVVKGEPLRDVLAFLTSVVEEQSGDEVVASILLLDDGGHLRPGAAPSLPAEYVQAMSARRTGSEKYSLAAAHR